MTNGEFKNCKITDGVYFYRISAISVNDKEEFFNGYLHLLSN